MKRLLIIIFSVTQLANTTSAQKDSIPKTGIIIELNPIEFLLGLVGNRQGSVPGECGGFIEIPMEEKLSFLAGFGYNTDPHGDGYTIHLGFSKFTVSQFYTSFQFLFRTWNLKNIHDYLWDDPGLPSGQDDYVLDITTRFPFDGEQNGFNYENVTVHVYDISGVWGKQGDVFHLKHLIYKWYVGGGLRLKDIQVNIYGSSDRSGSGFYPHPSGGQPAYQSYNTIYPYPKTGFMIGYKF